MSTAEAQALLEPAATRVRDPVSGRSLWLAGMIVDGVLAQDVLKFTLKVQSAHTSADHERMVEALCRNLESIGWTGEIDCSVFLDAEPPAAKGPPPKDAVKGMGGPGMQPHGGPIQHRAIEGVKHIVAVASGKGGVGKSTLASNLAVALAQQGFSTGLMDADIYGPSLPTMMSISGRPLSSKERKILPLRNHGVACMSIGLLVEDSEPIIWRGPMVMGVVRQFLQDVAWGELDFLVVDLPPGTGDAQLTMIQAVPISGAVIITTPQEVALTDARRGIEMFRKLDVPVLGIVENMSWLEVPGGRIHPFGSGGGTRTAQRFQVPLLVEIPLDPDVGIACENGQPVALSAEGPGAFYHQVANHVSETLLGSSSVG